MEVLKLRLNNKILSFIIILSLFLAATLSITSTHEAVKDRGLADSPWPCFGGDARNTGRSPYHTNNIDGMLKWTFTTGDDIKSSPSIGPDGTIYVGSTDNKLYAINPDGTERWNFTTGANVISCPTVGKDGTIYVGSNDGNLYAINPDGTEKWRFKTQESISSSPVLGVDGTIYVVSYIQKFFMSHYSVLYAINPDGTKKWVYKGKKLRGEGIKKSIAINSTRHIFVCSYDAFDSHIHSFTHDGKHNWKVNEGFFTPSIGDDGTIFVSSNHNTLSALNPKGSKRWTYSAKLYNQFSTSPSLAKDGTIYIGSSNISVTTDSEGERINLGPHYLFAIDSDGKKKWKFPVNGEIWSSPAIAADGTIYFGSMDGNLYSVNPSGTERWSFNTSGSIESSPAIGKDGTIYIGSNDNKLYAIGGTFMDEVVIIGGIAGIGVAATVYWYYRKEDLE